MNLRGRRTPASTFDLDDGDKTYDMDGGVLNQTHDPLPAVTFMSSQSFLSLPRWDASSNGSLSFAFKTNEGNGVIIFSRGIRNPGPDDYESAPDFFAVELLGGHLFLLLSMGSGTMKIKCSTRRLDDSSWHSFQLTRDGKTGRAYVDEGYVSFVAPGPEVYLDLEGSLYVGAVGTSGLLTAPSSTKWPPPELWSASLGYGFVGCMLNMTVNGVPQNLSAYAEQQDSAGVRVGCLHSSTTHCFPSSCLNQGSCIEGWNRRICSCISTGYYGPVCAKESLILSFNGDQSLKWMLPQTSVTQAEDISIRFRTIRASGFLFACISEKELNFIVIYMESGRLKVILNLGEGDRESIVGQYLNDDVWHSLKIERRGPWLEIRLDATQHVSEINGMLITLNVNSVYLGSMTWKKQVDIASGASSTFLSSLHFVPDFEGMMQSIIFNGHDLVDLSRFGQIYGIFESTADLDLTPERELMDYSLFAAVTFKSKWTYVAMQQMSAFSRMSLSFQFRTLSANGLILFNSGKNNHFIAVEMVNSRIVYCFNMGDGAKRLSSQMKNLNDNNWHSVTIRRTADNRHSLRVDDRTTNLPSSGVNTHLFLAGNLMIGGVPRDKYSDLPKAIKARNGFEGCLANLEVDDELLDPSDQSKVVTPSTLVAPGCSYASFISSTGSSSFGQDFRCPVTCNQRGVCVKYMRDRSACDCDQSSFATSSCSEEGVSFRFGLAPSDSASPSMSWNSTPEDLIVGGLVTVNFPDGHRIDTKSDTLTLGIMTEQENSVILRVDSGSTSDYMELQIVEGRILMAYNVGSEDHDITDPNVSVSDNKYHVIRFTRSGPNSTLQLDQHNPISRSSINRKQTTIFDSLAKIQIGGLLKSDDASGSFDIMRPFQGIISGLTFNGMMILDLAAEKDERIIVRGSASLLTQLPKKFNPSSISFLLSNESRSKNSASDSLPDSPDELIVSRDSMQFCWTDDECQQHKDPMPTTADDLITPFLTDSFSSTISAMHTEGISCAQDSDDEDCAEGSGNETSVDGDDDGTDEDLDAVVPTPKLNPTPDVDDRSSTTTQQLSEPFEFRLPVTTQSSTNSTLSASVVPLESLTTKKIDTTTTASFVDPKDLEQSYRPRSTTSSYPSSFWHKKRPEINQVPKPSTKKPISEVRVVGGREKNSQHPVNRSPNFSSVDRTALTVGVIATIIIVIVFVAPILLFTKLRMMDPPSLSQPHINGQMIYSESVPGSHHPQSSKTGPQYSSLPPATLITPDGRVFNQSPALSVINHQLQQPLHQQYISDPCRGPTSILKKKRNSRDEWFV